MDTKLLDTGLIYTDSQNCIGCNNCIRQCPTLKANVGIIDDTGVCKIHLDEKECILCGTCLDSCTHDVRRFRDDCDVFLRDLNSGRQISLLIAPAFFLTYPNEYKKVLGYLKSLGVNKFYSVSFGADITTWAYLQYITSNSAFGKISQPCPAIVSHIEKHQPDLIETLMPIQSPMMCTAIYLKKYMGVTDDLAFLSPCIAKKDEMMSLRGLGHIGYNVTFSNFMNHIRNQDIMLTQFEDFDDEIDYGLGSLYPVPGGLRENVEFYLGDDALVVQSEGELHVYEYLQQFNSHSTAWKLRGISPTLVDVLNCGRGCNYGTATEYRHMENSYIQIDTLELKRKKRAELKKRAQEAFQNGEDITDAKRNLAVLNDKFKHLNLNDFTCRYENKNISTRDVSKQEIEYAYAEMLKHTHIEKVYNCGACGYKTCKDMAKAMTFGVNNKSNCAEYIKALVKEQMEYQSSVINHFKEVGALINQLNNDNIQISDDTSKINIRVGEAVTYSEKMHTSLQNLQEELSQIIASYSQISTVARTTNILSINASIEAAHAGSLGKGFSVIASEMGGLAKKVLQLAGESESSSVSVVNVLGELSDIVSTFSSMIDEIKGSTNEIGGNVGKITTSTENIMELVRNLENEADKV